MSDNDKASGPSYGQFSSAEMGALAHMYRGEVYRSTIWRTRLDNTTNWSVVTLGIALSLTFASPTASALPLLLVGVLIVFFMTVEARRYRYFNVWRARARWMENHLYAPMLDGETSQKSEAWRAVLARDYRHPRYHVSFMAALGRRLRRNYIWILMIQAIAYFGKIIIHPAPIGSIEQMVERADIGPVPGEIILSAGVVYNLTWIGLAIWTHYRDKRRFRHRHAESAMG